VTRVNARLQLATMPLLIELEFLVVTVGIGAMEGLKKRVESRRPGGRYLAPVQTIYLFRCGESGFMPSPLTQKVTSFHRGYIPGYVGVLSG
jgi:hypothetical protein